MAKPSSRTKKVGTAVPTSKPRKPSAKARRSRQLAERIAAAKHPSTQPKLQHVLQLQNRVTCP